jgi:enediyne biosynthesis thioesterase
MTPAARQPAYEHHHVVTYEETNAVGNVYFATYFKWQGMVRELFLAEHAPSVLADLATNHALVTTDANCSYLSELWPFDRLIIRLHASTPVHNRLGLRYEYWRSAPDRPPELVARGAQTVAWYERVPGGAPRPIPVPQELTDTIERAHAAAVTAPTPNGLKRERR